MFFVFFYFCLVYASSGWCNNFINNVRTKPLRPEFPRIAENNCEHCSYSAAFQRESGGLMELSLSQKTLKSSGR